MSRPGGRTYGAVGLCLVVLAVVGVVVVRAVQWNGSVTLLANWSGANERQFRQEVIRPFEAKEHIHVLYQGSSAESQVLAADVEAGTPPDVAVLPGPGELAAYASQGRLQPLDGLIDTKDFDAPWTPMIPGKDKVPRDYWVPIKTDLKSLVWYPDGMSAQQRGAYAADPGSWCLGLVSAATSGWPATDWLEDVLLQQAGRDTYEKWATGRLRWTDPAVRRAWQTWGAMVGAGKGSYTRPALDRPYDKVSRTEVNGRPPCTLEHQASFVRTEKGWSHDAGYVHSKELVPGARADQDAWEVSGDLAAVLHGTPQARKLISYLARSDVQARWSLSQAGFSADHAVDQSVYGTDPVTKDIAKIIDGPKTVRCYDASDAMPAVMRDAFELAAMRYFAEPTTLTEQLANLESVRQRHGLQWLPKVCGG